MHPPPLTGAGASSLTTSASCVLSRATCSGIAVCHAQRQLHPLLTARSASVDQLRPTQVLWAVKLSAFVPTAHRRCWRPRTTHTAHHRSAALRCPGGLSSARTWIGDVTGAALPSAWCTARRHASTGRRPTYIEITEALDVLGVSIDEDPKVVKAKYRELVKKNHPDAGGDAATMAKVTVAYDRLSSLSNREKEEYQTQRRMFHSGRVGSTRRYRPGPAGGYGYAVPNGPFQARAANMYGQYYQQDANTAYQQTHHAGQQSYWNQYHNRAGSASFSENPFNFSNPFSMNAQVRRARFLPPGTLLLQGLVVYLVLSAFFLFAYRRYRDWRHDDGWRMSESLARHEQMQEMHRIRQEMNERARAMLMRDGSGGDGEADRGFFSSINGLYGSRQFVGESPEARALEYARQRRIQMMQEQQDAAVNAPELRGWPKIDEEKGRIIKRAQDPSGVVFFEPRREDTRRRQIENQRRASGFTRRATTPQSAPSAAAPAEQDVTAAAAASDDAKVESEGSSAGAGSNNGPPLPPESNVGAVMMKPVGNEQEAQAVMRGIFAGLRRNSS
ncbi:putative mitochondrial chaperone protein DNAj [Leptomonas pyrrhocoris]|uniref:Putative mitochondrial chaperone protein DNAj n=1 Tax=Leptomonas pyrrhocoris TaxID=157538 RepID=A0A0M9FRB8_LEPPY|nr:putative mitochondrial chaperone protein DNAj [Leptomonas pyrrhocoris]KPA74286.1 putative mitochondrial chaperone protein DNAj [Leptomonas pyrrhocoris]|eukprot:XP_015652725.1 putative mitochondrial chaperone protein DNAj [Leptomonas pyrrhocoris]